jgi:Ca2+-binding EF-hand superfamily protein
MRKKAGLAAGEVSGGELRTLFAAMDLDENGSVSLAEFQQFVSYRWWWWGQHAAADDAVDDIS